MGGCVSECANKAGLSEGQFESAGMDDVKTVHDEVDAAADAMKEPKHVSFVDSPEEVVAKRGSNSLSRRGTGFETHVGGDLLPRVSFQEPEESPAEEEAEHRHSMLRQSTGFVFQAQVKVREEEDGDRPKVSFEDAESVKASEKQRSSFTRKGTGFVNSGPQGSPETPLRKGVQTRKGTGYVHDDDLPTDHGSESE